MSSPLIWGSALGLLSHWTWFIHGEHDNLASHYAYLASLSPAAVFICVLIWCQSHLFDALMCTIVLLSSFYTALTASIVTYRLLFHPLRHVPGPLGLKVSKLFHLWAIRDFKNYRYLQSLHVEYGDVARTGPNEITFFTPSAFETIYNSNKTGFPRSVFFDGLRPLTSVIASRDIAGHARMRKPWNKALGHHTLRLAAPVMARKVQQLIARLAEHAATPIDLSEWLEKAAIDVIGELAISIDYGLLQGRGAEILTRMRAGRTSLGYSAPVPWLKKAAKILPSVRKGFDGLVIWGNQLLDQRIAREKTEELHDVFKYLLEDESTNGTLNKGRLLGELVGFLSAGADPVSSTSTLALYYLYSDEERLQKVRAELDRVADIYEPQNLLSLPYFNATINEVMRLHTPVPSAGLRAVPPGGAVIDGMHVPGGTTVLVPKHSLFRRCDCFVDPDKFLPERFIEPSDLVIQPIFAPFGRGDFDCAGRKVGLMEIRLTIAAVLKAFDATLLDAGGSVQVVTEINDCFTTMAGPLRIVLQMR